MDIGNTVAKMVHIWAQFPPHILSQFQWCISPETAIVISNHVGFKGDLEIAPDSITFMGIPIDMSIDYPEILFAIKV